LQQRALVILQTRANTLTFHIDVIAIEMPLTFRQRGGVAKKMQRSQDRFAFDRMNDD